MHDLPLALGNAQTSLEIDPEHVGTVLHPEGSERGPDSVAYIDRAEEAVRSSSRAHQIGRASQLLASSQSVSQIILDGSARHGRSEGHVGVACLRDPFPYDDQCGGLFESGAISGKLELREVPERQPVFAEVVPDDLRADPAVGHQRADDAVSYGGAREDRPDLLRRRGDLIRERRGGVTSAYVDPAHRRAARVLSPRVDGLDGAVDVGAGVLRLRLGLDEVEDHVAERLVAHLRQSLRAGLHRPTEGCEPPGVDVRSGSTTLGDVSMPAAAVLAFRQEGCEAWGAIWGHGRGHGRLGSNSLSY